MKIQRLTNYVAPALLLGLLFFGCRKKVDEKPAETPAPSVSADAQVVATVNGDPITLAEFQERFSRAGFKADAGVEYELKEAFLNRLIERKMLLLEASRRRIKIAVPDINARIEKLRAEHGKDIREELTTLGIDYEKWKSDIWEDMMIERLIAHDVNRHVSVTPSEVRRYYEANPQEFEKPEQVRVRQIVVASEEEARKVMELLQAANADFASIAREMSTAPEAEKGGDLGYFARGEMPADFNVVFGLPKGGISEIVKSPYGYHIFKLEDRRAAGKISLENASKEITEKLRQAKVDSRYKQWLKELRSRTKFEVNYHLLGQKS
ncbi:MAG TPA: peptidyl-prolyl cis-trans isomerase [Nitrospirota bacterium]|nr:peptidyl-prolyl cis-trans isomerase [Nitrospirota bacterium]